MFLVVEADPITGIAAARVVAPGPDGVAQLIDDYPLDRELSSIPPDPASVHRDPAGFGVHARPGRLSWTVFSQAPNGFHPLHHTDTIDLDTVLAGSVVLTAGGVDSELMTGDCVLLAGVPHAWRAGPDGCVLSVVFLGGRRSNR